jgi:hypothetical protein
MIKSITSIFILFSFSGCTQVVTAPIYVAGAVVSTSIDVTGSAVGAVIDASSDEKD